MNKAILIGRLTRDPDLKYTSGGDTVAKFTLAVNRNFKNKDGKYDADFINVVVWRKQAENVANYLGKGRQAAVSGRIQTRTYDDKEGKKVYVTEVVADEIQFLDTKHSESKPESKHDDGFMPIDDTDVPF